MEGGSAHSGDGDIVLTTATDDADPAARWWWAAAVAALAIGAVVVWQSSGDGEPSAIMTATDVSTSAAAATDAPSTTTSTAPTDDARSATVDSVDSGPSDVSATTSSTAPRPVVPASTTTAPSPSTSTSAPSTIVVSATADTNAPRVSLVDDAVTEVVVIDPVPNTSLDGADRTAASTTPTTLAPRLICDGPTIRFDPLAHRDAGGIAAESADGAAATITSSGQGIGVIGGRDNDRIDYSAEQGASERVFIELGGQRCAVSIEVGDLASGEWNGVDESVHWVGLGSDNRTIGEGWLLGSASEPFDLPLAAPIERLLLEAAPYGTTADGWPPGADREINDNSDFVLVAVIVR